jgi:hypothetical protein
MYSIWVVQVKRYQFSANLCTSVTPVAREVQAFPAIAVTLGYCLTMTISSLRAVFLAVLAGTAARS